MSSKFEQLLDLLVNEEHEKANELFHEIVVEKSREIYDNMIAEEADDEEDESVEEASEEDDEEAVEEGFGDEEESMYEIGGDDELGGDAADDLVNDVEDHDAFGGDHDDEDGDEPATKDDVLDIADALEELKAEFQALLTAEKNEEEENPDVHGGALDSLDQDDDGDHDMKDHDLEDEDEEDADDVFMREYREVVGKPYAGGKVAGSTEEASTNKTSPVSSAKGRPTTGATAGNIAQSKAGEDKKAGVGGVLKAGGEFTKGVTTNLDGKTSGVKTLSKVAAGHGAEKKGSGESNVNDKNTLPK